MRCGAAHLFHRKIETEGADATGRVYKEVFAKVSLHYRKTLIRKKVGPLFERVRLLFTHTSAPVEEPSTRFNGALLQQMRDDVYVFMHQIDPRQ